MNEVVQHSAKKDVIVLSEAAKAHILRYLENNASSKGIRFSLKKTGCSGLSYNIDFVDKINEEDIISPITEQYAVFIDKGSYPFLKGVTVDYVRQGLNEKFVFENPNQTGQCGCGESFTVS